MAREDWLTERVREFTDLRGRTVRTWTGVEMAFFEDPPLLLAGEAYEYRGDNLYFCRLDESVLAFTDPAVVDTIPWR